MSSFLRSLLKSLLMNVPIMLVGGFIVGLFSAVIIVVSVFQNHFGISSDFSNWYPPMVFVVFFAPITIFFLLPWKSKLLNGIGSLVIALYYFLTTVDVYYTVTRGEVFDFFYFWVNRSIAIDTIDALYDHILLKFLLGLCIFLFFVTCVFLSKLNITKKIRKTKKLRKASWPVAILLIIAFVTFFDVLPLHQLIISAKLTSRALHFDTYNEYYLNSRADEQPAIPSELKNQNSLVFLHLESVNQEFVTKEYLPNLFEFASNGIFFQKHHSNGIQTVRAQEPILCGSYPSLNLSSDIFSDIANSIDEDPDKVERYCLPEILNQAGYKTLYFQSFADLSYQGVSTLMEQAGFDEVHGDDIVAGDIPELKWGAREDAYYNAVLRYLKENYRNEKIFAYVEVSSTNHLPWDVSQDVIREDIFTSLPFPYESGIPAYERRIDALFAQDAYMKEFIDGYQEIFGLEATDFFVFGDHPMAINKNNPEFSYNIGSYNEDIFLTTMAMVPAKNHRDEFNTGQIYTEDVQTGHQNLSATVLDLLGISNVFPYSPSIEPLLRGSASFASCSVNVQPFLKTAIALTQYPHKVVLDLRSNDVKYINLAEGEEIRVLEGDLKNAEMYLEKCSQHKLDTIDIQ